MNRDKRAYQSYLIRLWQVRGDDAVLWRASLENPLTGECHGFASLKALFEFLEEQANSSLLQTQIIDNNIVGPPHPLNADP
jgi:hypothetical protein